MVRRTSPVRDVDLVRVRGGDVTLAGDWLAVEEPLEIRAAAPGLAAAPIAVTMRTPGHDDELAVGYLFGEGLVDGRADLDDPPVVADGAAVVVRLARPFDAEAARREVPVGSSCGVCGAASIDRLVDLAPPVGQGPVVRRAALAAMPAALRAGQAAFERTGGLHAAGLFGADGARVVVREDVGRHNAVDKLCGRALLDGRLPLDRLVLLVSGRVSFEIVQKAARAGVTVLAAVSAPTSLAAQAADRLGLTLVGFLRDGGFNVYTHPRRVDLAGA